MAKFVFNPLTGNFDVVGITTLPPGTGDVIGPGSSTTGDIAIFSDGTGKNIADSGVSIDAIQAYSQVFLVADWAGPSGGSYSLTILKATHKQNNPICTVYELSGSDYIQVDTGVKINASEDVIITVNSVPDLRFIGKVVIN